MNSLSICPVNITDARSYCRQFHRHHPPPQGGLFAIACAEGATIRGIVIVGRPISRMLQDGYTAEVTRLATDGVKNGCSMLYAAAWRAARAMGYRRLITYILDTENGTSLKASGWKLIGRAGGVVGAEKDGRASTSPRLKESFAMRYAHDAF